MALLTVYEAGQTVTLVSADVNGDEFPNDGKTILLFNHVAATGKTITALGQRKTNFPDANTPNRVISLSAQTFLMSQRFNTQFFNDVNGRVQLTYDAVDNLRVAAVRLPDPDDASP